MSLGPLPKNIDHKFSAPDSTHAGTAFGECRKSGCALVGVSAFKADIASPLDCHVDRRDVVESDLSLERYGLVMLRDP